MIEPRSAVKAAGAYLRRHPEEVGRAVRGAAGLRFGVPIDAFRWLAQQVIPADKVEDLVIEDRPPGLRLAATFELMHSRIRAGAVLYIDRVTISASAMRLELRLEEVEMVPQGSERTHISALLRAKALDLSRPGDLIDNLPDMPPLIVGAFGNRIVLDLMEIPALADDPRVRHVLGFVSSLITLNRIETESGHLDLRFRALPQGLMAAADAVGDHLLSPTFDGVKAILPTRVRKGLGARLRKAVELVAGEDLSRSFSPRRAEAQGAA